MSVFGGIVPAPRFGNRCVISLIDMESMWLAALPDDGRVYAVKWLQGWINTNPPNQPVCIIPGQNIRHVQVICPPIHRLVCLCAAVRLAFRVVVGVLSTPSRKPDVSTEGSIRNIGPSKLIVRGKLNHSAYCSAFFRPARRRGGYDGVNSAQSLHQIYFEDVKWKQT